MVVETIELSSFVRILLITQVISCICVGFAMFKIARLEREILVTKHILIRLSQ